MRQYFSQFGPIARLRLSRNKRTGASRHYAFLEFESAAVARIVAETMNNYLMFGHILKTRFMEKDQIHEGMWKGANRRFKKVPWNAIEGRKLSQGIGREDWGKRIEREASRRASKGEKLKEIGYEFEGAALKGVDTLPIKEGKADPDTEMAETKLVEEERTVVVSPPHAGHAALVVAESIITTTTTTKNKKGSKAKVANPEIEDGTSSTAAANSAVAKQAKDGAVEVAKKAKRKSEDAGAAVAKKAKK